jgi:DNA-binding CsgD family transcriptional regulator
MIAGSALWITAAWSTSNNILLIVVCGLLTGLGSAILLMQWGRVFGSIPATTSNIESAISYLSAAVVFLLLSFLPLPASIVVIAILPLASIYYLFKQGTPLEAGAKTSQESVLVVMRDPFILKLLFGALLIGCSVGIANEFYFISKPTPSHEASAIQFFLAAALAPLIMLLVSVFSKRRDFGFAYRPTMALMIFGVIMIPFFAQSPQMTGWIVLVGYHCFDLMLWTLLADLSYRFHISPILSFGLGRGLLYFASGLGNLLGSVFRLQSGEGFDLATLSVASTILTLVLIVTYCFVLTEKDLFSYEGVEKVDKDGKPGSIMQACSQIADLYNLSPREEAVMRLLVKGRSINRIQEEIYVSKGTVNTHLHHIYQKLDIHTKQELLDLVEKGKRPDAKHSARETKGGNAKK